MNIILGVDGGSSKTMARLEVLPDRTQYVGTVHGGTNLYATNESSARRALKWAVAEALKAGGLQHEPIELSACVIGTAGMAVRDDEARHREVFRAGLMELGLTRGHPPIHVVSDVDIILGCSSLDRRVALIAGTGSNCCAVRCENGHEVQRHYFGGMGLELSDEGSAAWIGHMACRTALLAAQGVISSRLARPVYANFDIDLDRPDAWRRLLSVRQGISKAALAALAPIVDAHADDEHANRILLQAGEDLGRLAVAALKRVGMKPGKYPVPSADLLLVGGVWSNDRIFQKFENSLRGFEPIIHRGVDPTVGALAIARSMAT